MLPKNRRIPRKMFPFLASGSRTCRNNIFLLRFVLKSDKNSRLPDSPARFCFSVSKKISKNAVVRNRLRRVGYRLLQRYLSEIKPNILSVFSFIKLPKDNEDIAVNLEAILKESKLIK